jgi:dipeptide/tripeptide permease
MNMGGQIGGAVTGSLTPLIAARYGWTASFLVAAALCMLGAVGWLAVDPFNTLTQAQSTIAEENEAHSHQAAHQSRIAPANS